MTKIFGIGLSRTGTKSLTEALRILGYSATHFPKSLQEIDAHDASTDTSVAFIYKDLDILYPEAKFILTVRNKADWLRSCRWHFTHEVPLEAYDEPTRQLAIAVRETLYGGVDFDAERFSRAYDRHVDGVRAYFAAREHRLLSVDLCRVSQRWAALCSFLGKPVPLVPFPEKNTRLAEPSRAARILRRLHAAVTPRFATRRHKGGIE